MTDYIEREAALAVMAQWLESVFGIREQDGTTTVYKRMRAIPAADVRPVVRGRWIFDDPLRADFMCSACLERQIVCSNYCPYCGSLNKEDEG